MSPVVQWVRGCQFQSSLQDGVVKVKHSIARDFFGGTVTFLHPDWVIDTNDTDPAYNSSVDRGVPRHHYYRWNSVPDSFDKKTQHYYGNEKPSRPQLYVRDMPGSAFTSATAQGMEAKNIPLQFRSCVFKIADVPERSEVSGESFQSKALLCFDWASSYAYDFEKGRFESPAGVAEACLKIE